MGIRLGACISSTCLPRRILSHHVEGEESVREGFVWIWKLLAPAAAKGINTGPGLWTDEENTESRS